MVITCSYNWDIKASTCVDIFVPQTENPTFQSNPSSQGNPKNPEPTNSRVIGSEFQTTNTQTTNTDTRFGQTLTTVTSVASPSTAAPQPSTSAKHVIESSTPLPDVGSGGGSQGVSRGAVAGIAIATTILGAAIALLAVFFFLKRRGRSSGRPYRDFTSEFGSQLNVKNTPYVQVSQSSRSHPVHAAAVLSEKKDLNVANLSNSSDFLGGILASAANEESVKTKVAGLFKRFQDHVDSYYRDVHATMTPSMQSDLTRFGDDLVEILEHSSVPTVAIKHALAGYILSIVSPEAEDQATLFPAEIAGLKANERSPDAEDQPVYILYKRLAVHLHLPNHASLQSRKSDIQEAAEHFALTFFPWANPAFSEQDKDEELVQIIGDALETSIWLFGQPHIYEFVWEGVGRRGTVVVPGLAKLTDDRGNTLDRSQILLEPGVAAS